MGIALDVPLSPLLSDFLAQVLQQSQSTIVLRNLSVRLELQCQSIVVSLSSRRHLTLKWWPHTHHNFEIIRVSLRSSHSLAQVGRETLAKLRQSTILTEAPCGRHTTTKPARCEVPAELAR